MLIVDIWRSESGNEYTLVDDTNTRYAISAGDFKRCGIPFFESNDDYPIEVSDDLRENLSFYSDKLRCIKYLQWYIASYGEKSRKRLFEKCMDNNYSRECADTALELMCEFGILNETEACKRRISVYANEKLYGRHRIRNELLNKGYLRDNIDAAFSEMEIDYYENAVKMYLKLTKRGVPESISEKKKIADKMVRYGYSFDEIKYASNCEFDE